MPEDFDPTKSPEAMAKALMEGKPQPSDFLNPMGPMKPAAPKVQGNLSATEKAIIEQGAQRGLAPNEIATQLPGRRPSVVQAYLGNKDFTSETPKVPQATTWQDPAMDAKLRDLHAQGLPFSQIGDQLGLTKNQAVGRANRLGLVRALQQPAPIPQPAPPPPVVQQPRPPFARQTPSLPQLNFMKLPDPESY